jgi:hypothetical protein
MVPLVVCPVHAQLVYEDSYRQLSPIQMKRGRKAFVRQYGVPTLLVLGREGEIRRRASARLGDSISFSRPAQLEAGHELRLYGDARWPTGPTVVQKSARLLRKGKE